MAGLDHCWDSEWRIFSLLRWHLQDLLHEALLVWRGR